MSRTHVLCAKSLQSCPALCNPVGCGQAPLSVGFSRHEYGSRLPFPSPGNLSSPGIELHLLCLATSLMSSVCVCVCVCVWVGVGVCGCVYVLSRSVVSDSF